MYKLIISLLIIINIITFSVSILAKFKFEKIIQQKNLNILSLNKQYKECNEDNKELFLYFTSENNK